MKNCETQCVKFFSSKDRKNICSAEYTSKCGINGILRAVSYPKRNHFMARQQYFFTIQYYTFEFNSLQV